MTQEGTRPVPSQDGTNRSNPSPSTTSKTPRTLSFINNVQTAVAQIEDKLASSPSASPPPPNRNEIPVNPPGPDHPVIDRVQFLESSLAISPSNRTTMSSLAESVFGGAINQDPSLASPGVFVSTTPRPNPNSTTSNPSSSPKPSHPTPQTNTDLINDLAANDTRAAPSIAPIVEQFETPATPVFSKENDSQIVGAPIAQIVEQFEHPVTATDSINQQDLVEFASGMVGPVVDQFEHPTIAEPDANILQQTETSDSKQAATTSQHPGETEEFEPLPQETAIIVETDSAGADDEIAQTSTSATDRSQDRSTAVRNLPTVPLVEGLDSIPGSPENGSPSNDEVIQKGTIESDTNSLTVLNEDVASAPPFMEDNTSSRLDGASIAKASPAESHDMHKETDGLSESSNSKRTTIASNHSEKGEEREGDELAIQLETELLSSSEAPPLPSVSKKENTSSQHTAATVLPEACNFDVAGKPGDQRPICEVPAVNDTAKESAADVADANTNSDALVNDDFKTTVATKTTELTKSHATNAHYESSGDSTGTEDLGTETVAPVTAREKEDSNSLEDCMSNETAQAPSAETLKSIAGKSNTFNANSMVSETTTEVVAGMAPSSDDVAAGDATDNSYSVDDTAKTPVCEIADSEEEGNNAANDENASNEVSRTSTKGLVDSVFEKITSDREIVMANDAADNHVTEMLELTRNARTSSEMQSMDPVANIVRPVTKTIPENRSSIASESVRPVGRLVENNSILNNTIENRCTDGTTSATEAGTPEIQLDNSMNITIVVQTTSTPVSAGVTISADDCSRAGKQPTPTRAHNVSGDGQSALEDLATSALEGPASNEQFETATNAMQKREMVSPRTPTVSSAETEVASFVKEEELTSSRRTERVSRTSNGEQPAASEQESLDTVTRRALLAREKLGKSYHDRPIKSLCVTPPRTDLLQQTDKLIASGTPGALCDSSNVAPNRSAWCEEPIRSKSSGHAELRSPSAPSNRANTGTGGRIHRQSFSRGAITPSPGSKKRQSAARSVQNKAKKLPQSAPASPLRLSKSSARSAPRLPRVAGLPSTRSRHSLSEGPPGRNSRSSTFPSSIPKSHSRLSSPLLTRKSGLSSSPVTPKSASKPSGAPRLPLRRTLSFTNNRMLDSPRFGSSHIRYSLSQKVEEMKRQSDNRGSAAQLSGSGSKPPLGRRQRVTVPEPFALFGPELHEMSEKQMDDARRRQEEEAARPRVFKPRPMPSFLKEDTSPLARKGETKN